MAKRTTLHGAFGAESKAKSKQTELKKKYPSASVTVSKAKNGRYVVKMVK